VIRDLRFEPKADYFSDAEVHDEKIALFAIISRPAHVFCLRFKTGAGRPFPFDADGKLRNVPAGGGGAWG
jgi:hypothetical protein